MNNFETESSWTNNDACSKVERAHGFIIVCYGILAGLMCLVLLSGLGSSNPEFTSQASFLAGLAALIFAHVKTKAALEDGKSWATPASAMLMILPLFGFPFGTAIAIYAYVNLAKIKTPVPSALPQENDKA